MSYVPKYILKLSHKLHTWLHTGVRSDMGLIQIVLNLSDQGRDMRRFDNDYKPYITLGSDPINFKESNIKFDSFAQRLSAEKFKQVECTKLWKVLEVCAKSFTKVVYGVVFPFKIVEAHCSVCWERTNDLLTETVQYSFVFFLIYLIGRKLKRWKRHFKRTGNLSLSLGMFRDMNAMNNNSTPRVCFTGVPTSCFWCCIWSPSRKECILFAVVSAAFWRLQIILLGSCSHLVTGRVRCKPFWKRRWLVGFLVLVFLLSADGSRCSQSRRSLSEVLWDV